MLRQEVTYILVPVLSYINSTLLIFVLRLTIQNLPPWLMVQKLDLKTWELVASPFIKIVLFQLIFLYFISKVRHPDVHIYTRICIVSTQRQRQIATLEVIPIIDVSMYLWFAYVLPCQDMWQSLSGNMVTQMNLRQHGRMFLGEFFTLVMSVDAISVTWSVWHLSLFDNLVACVFLCFSERRC